MIPKLTSQHLRAIRVGIAAFLFLSFAQMIHAQIASGLLDVAVSHGGVTIIVTGSPGFTVRAVSNADGEVKFLLPYGNYVVTVGGSRQRVHVAPLAVTHAVLQPGRMVEAVRPPPPQTFSVPAQLLMKSPSIVTYPLDFAGLQNNRLALISLRGTSWTNTSYRLQGMDATDSYQPGIPLVLADTHALDEVSLSEGAEIRLYGRNPMDAMHSYRPGVPVAQPSRNSPLPGDRPEIRPLARYPADSMQSYQPPISQLLADTHALDEVSLSEEPDIGIFVRNPSESWHAALTTSDTGRGLTSDNLPPPSQRGEVLQPEGYRWFTNDHAETGGPVTRRADVFLSGTGQWASQTVEQAQPGNDLTSRLLFANARGRTGLGLAPGNLPLPPQRGAVWQPEGYRGFTNSHAETGAPVEQAQLGNANASGRMRRGLVPDNLPWPSQRGDPVTSQWAPQTVQQAQPGNDLTSRLLFANARGRVRLSSRDQLDAQYTGSRIDLSGWGFPQGIQALTGRPMGPSLYGVTGFPDLSEVDHMDFVQLGWTRVLPASSGAGILQIRYGYSTAHLDTRPNRAISGASMTELANPIGSGAPLWNLAVRTRHDFEAAYEPAEIALGSTKHQIAVGGGWQTAHPRNRLEAPFDENLIDANGVPAFLVQLNTPLDSRESIESFSPYIHDHAALTPWLSIDASVFADVSRGGLPAQSSPAGLFTPARQFPARPDVIAWNNIAPRAGLALRVPHLPLVLRGSYARFEHPLAGRYLDFANPNSIGGLEYSTATGQLLQRFGGPYSTVSPLLKQPYSDNFSLSAETSLPLRTTATARLYRSDEKDRIAAINTGVPFSAYSAQVIDDPGPDFIPGTFDDRQITIYSQNPATFGQDRYLLTNPPGLRGLNEGFLAEVSTQQRYATASAMFFAMKSFGPTNPGNSVFGNDFSVIGGLLGGKNALINASGHTFFDRAYAGKLEIDGRLPKKFGGVEIANIADYFDGLPFARQLLVTGLPQGPLLVATTIRGSPEGGNRAQYVLNWNLRVSRDFALRVGTLSASANVFNVLNANHSVEEEDMSGPLFNQRLPIAIQAARFVRIGVGYRF